MTRWVCDLNFNLPLADAGVTFDAKAASEAILFWATRPDGAVDPERARQCFLLTDLDNADLRHSYAHPIAVPIDGKPQVMPGAIKSAQEKYYARGLPTATLQRAQATIDHYLSRIRQAEIEAERKAGKPVSLTREEAAELVYRHGLDFGLVCREKTDNGPVVMIFPQHTPPAALNGFDEPSGAECFHAAALLIDHALATGYRPSSPYDLDVRKFIDVLWDLLEAQLMQRVERSPELRQHIEREARLRTDEICFGAREMARREGLISARHVIQTLAKGLSEPDHGARAMLLAANSREISAALEGRLVS